MTEGRQEEGRQPEDRPEAEAALARGREAVQPFRLVKYFSLTGFIVILISTLFLTVFISQQAKSMLLKKSEEFALLSAQNLNHQVFVYFVVPAAARFGRIRLSDPVQYERLDRVVRSTIHSFKVEKINIYDLEGTITYSTDTELVGQERSAPAYKAALKGEHTSTLITRSGSGLARLEHERLLRTFYPFRAEESDEGPVGQVLGVFEIIQDLSSDYAEIARFQYLSIGLSLLFISVMFVILRLILHRADRIIEQRNEERRRLEERLHHSQRLANLGQMVAAVSHEVRNPLGIISSTAEILLGKIKKYEPSNELAEVIVEESRRLNEIVTEFLDFARPQVPKPEACRLEDLLEKNLNFLAPQIEKSGIEVVRRYNGPKVIEADPDLLYRAFLNVFLNAIQALPQGGRITVSTAAPDGRSPGRVEVAIADTGPGVKPEHAELIFNPFFTTKDKGSGLGLAIVRNIVESHHGEVALEAAEGGGSRVVIRLPLTQG